MLEVVPTKIDGASSKLIFVNVQEFMLADYQRWQWGFLPFGPEIQYNRQGSILDGD